MNRPPVERTALLPGLLDWKRCHERRVDAAVGQLLTVDRIDAHWHQRPCAQPLQPVWAFDDLVESANASLLLSDPAGIVEESLDVRQIERQPCVTEFLVALSPRAVNRDAITFSDDGPVVVVRAAEENAPAGAHLFRVQHELP